MNLEELSQEFEKAKLVHKFSVCATVLERELIEEINSKVNIPAFLLKDQIRQEVIERIKSSLSNNTFEDMYNSAWEILKDNI